MTKKEWNKLKLQVVLGSTLDQHFIFSETGWCGNCIHFNKQKINHCGGFCIPTTIETIDKKGDIIRSAWMTGYYPRKFDD